MTTGTKRFDICLGLIILSTFFSFVLWKGTPVKREVVERITEKTVEIKPDNPCKDISRWEQQESCNAAYVCKMQNGRLVEYKGAKDFKCEYVKEIKEVTGN